MSQFLMSRARRIFQYDDLNGTTMSEVLSSSSALPPDVERVSVESLTRTPCKRSKRLLMIVTAIGLLAVVITIGSALNINNNEEGVPAPASSSSSQANEVRSVTEQLLPVELRDVVYGAFRPKAFNGTWISDREIMYASGLGGIEVFNVQDNSLSYQVMSPSKTRTLLPLQWFMSSDKKYLLLKRTSHSVFRRSSYGKYSIVKLKPNGRSGSSIIDLKPPHAHHSPTGFMIRYAAWSPTGNGIAYIGFDNNLYVRRSVESKDEQLTTDGEPGRIFNGIPDWVFEEEVIQDNFALWWSPDSKKLVWGSFDDSNVKSYFLPQYGTWNQLIQYPTMKQLRYPKVNTTNPTSKLWLADLSRTSAGFNKLVVNPPESFEDMELLFTWVTWVDKDTFSVTWMNRVQDHTIVSLCQSTGSDCGKKENKIFEYRQKNGWVDINTRITFNPNPPNPTKKDFVVILPANFIKHHFRQIVHVTGGSFTYLTKAEADVTQVLAWAGDGYIYYLSTTPGNPGSRHMYRVMGLTNLPNTSAGPECLTCQDIDASHEIKYLNRTRCSYYSAHMSKDNTYFAMNCHGPDIPWTSIHETKTGHLVSVYENNKELESKMARYSLPTVLNMNVPVSDSDQMANVKLYLPPGFDPGKTYPLFVYSYGGPGAQQVDDKWNQDSYQTYASGTQGLVYAIIDPKGSGFQGDDWMFELYKGFGTAEVDSTIEVVRYLQKNLPYLNQSQTAIWGWSYGGFLSLSVLARDTDGIFSCGASVAPVTDWTLYDTYYTERYMGLLEGNQACYNKSSVFHYLDNLRNKKFFVMHGTSDDNVHLQQSMLLSAALESKDILFRQQLYPDQDHSIFLYHQHLYHSLTDFFINDCFS